MNITLKFSQLLVIYVFIEVVLLCFFDRKRLSLPKAGGEPKWPNLVGYTVDNKER